MLNHAFFVTCHIWECLWQCMSLGEMRNSWKVNDIKNAFDRQCITRGGSSIWIINTLRPEQNGRHFADGIFKRLFLKENAWNKELMPLLAYLSPGKRGYSWWLAIDLNTTKHYIDVIMTTMGSQITSLTVVYSTIYSGADQRKHQSSASLAFVWGIHRDRWIPRTKDQLRGKCFHLMTSSCQQTVYTLQCFAVVWCQSISLNLQG